MPQPQNPNPTKPGPRRAAEPDSAPPPKKKENVDPTKEGVRGSPPGKGR